MHSALAKLPEHQQELVNIIGEVRCERGRWPTLDYIERTFRRSTGGDAIATIYALPVVRRPSAPGGYQMVYGENRSIGLMLPEISSDREEHCLMSTSHVHSR